MALRLTQTPAATTALGRPASDDSPDVSIQTDPAVSRVENLASRAAGALLSGQAEAYFALFAEANDLPPHRRYQASKLILERGLAATRTIEDRPLISALTILAEATVVQLEENPAEPVLLNYAGVIFYELWCLDAARALFLAARRLDPELPNVDANIEGVRARRRSQAAQLRGRKGGFLHPALPSLSQRACRLAPRAQPGRGLRLSLCMIVKNEEEMLGRCLAAAAPGVDEIIVVDTGSTDRTIEIAHEFGALVIEREWTGSFSDARNASFEAATGDWILYLDADEVIVGQDVQQLRTLTGQTWREAFMLHETNFTGTEEAGCAVVHCAMRVFRNRPEYRFTGRLHEQILNSLPTYLPERFHQATIRVEHYGYLNSVRMAKRKSIRNIKLLLQARADGGEITPFDRFNLGSEYMVTGALGAAVDEFEQAWSLTSHINFHSAGHFLPVLASRLVISLRGIGRSELALERAVTALELFPNFTDLVYQQGLACVDLGRPDDAARHFERCIEMGDAPAGFTATVGCGTYLPRLSLARLATDEGDHGRAVELLRWCTRNYPTFYGTYQPYTHALIDFGLDPAAAIEEIEAILGDETNSMIRFILAAALVERSAPRDAAKQLNLVLIRRPDSIPATELLLETLLLSRDFESFASVAERFGKLDLSERERRERLGQMYLRHGFLRSAAREWMAVLDHAPDSGALQGLAEVARRIGQTDTAATFSAEALKLVPA